MKTLHITIRDKIATYMKRDGEIVCANGDYQIEFDFDSEWDAYDEKVARFVWNGTHYDQKFTGNICPVPIIDNATECLVGVHAEYISTTTPARIECLKSIRCGSTISRPENEKMYAEGAEGAAQRAEDAAERAEEIANNFDAGTYVEKDPTVPSWAKQATKPKYTASEVGALPANTKLADLESDSEHRTVTDEERERWNNAGSGTLTEESDPTVSAWAKQPNPPAESDPTVPAWAKSETKPTYKWDEITEKPAGFGPTYTYGTEDLVAGVSPLAEGTLYFVYK